MASAISIVVLLPTSADLPPMALRMTGLPGGMSTEQIDAWVDRLKRVADVAVRRQASARTNP